MEEDNAGFNLNTVVNFQTEIKDGWLNNDIQDGGPAPYWSYLCFRTLEQVKLCAFVM